MKIQLFMLFSALISTHSLSRSLFVSGIKQKQQTQARNKVVPTSTITERRYGPFRRHPELFQDTFQKEWLHDDFLQISRAFEEGASEDQDPDTIHPDLLNKEMDGVYSLNVFNADFIRMFNNELRNFYRVSEAYKIPVRRPNSMNNYGVVVNEIGMRNILSSFQQTYLWPVARRLFPIQASQIDDHHSFLVRYNADEDLGLDMHKDDSDVTFNVCLGEEGFTGGKLTFCGMFGAPNHRQFVHTYQHQIGRAVLHLGSRRHGADDIESGNRTNLIIWNHNWEYRSRGGGRNVDYQPEEGPPSTVCLSYTHDRDYTAFKELPESVQTGQTQIRPWCPPVGTEYEGFRTSKATERVNANTTTKHDGVMKNQQEL